MPGFGKMTVRKKNTNTNKKTKQNEQTNKQKKKWEIEMPGFGKMISHLISNVDILHDLEEIKYLSCRECFWSTVTVSPPA